MNGIYRFISTVFFIGYFPKIPGTFASICALFLWWIKPSSSVLTDILIIFILAIIGIIASDKTAKYLNLKDPSIIVIDELVGMWLSLLFIPKTILLFITAFIIFRILDIWKPLWIDTCQELSGGIGIMMDDIVAGIITCILIHVSIIIL